MSEGRAVFLDRDGTITEMVYYPEHGLVDSPSTASQLALVEGAGAVLRGLKGMGYRLILVSNQPGVAKRHFTMEAHDQIRAEMTRLLSQEGVRLDAEYYCFHHPQARNAPYRIDCDCRKPRPGMLFRAAKEQSVILADSVMIGDGISDVAAGRNAGTRTILIANLNSRTNRLMVGMGMEPNHVARNLQETLGLVQVFDSTGCR